MRLTVNALKRWMGAGVVLSLLVPSTAALAAESGGSQNRSDEKPDITLHGDAASGWTLTSAGNVLVDGRIAGTSTRLENGSRIVVDARSMARAEIADVGRIQIAPRSEVVLDMIDDTIVAKMLQGSMRVEVAARYGTYVETPGTTVVSHPGAYAAYRVKADPLAGTTVEKGLGDVEILAAADDSPKGWDIDVPDGDNDFHMMARKSETLKVKVKNGGGGVANQPVVFAITTALEGATGQFTEGVQRITTTTDNDGFATAEFQSGAGSGQVYVEAFVPGTDAHETLHVYIEAKEKTFWNPTTTTIYAAIGAGIVAGTVLAIRNRGRNENTVGIVVNPPVVGKQ
jgi:hypothetical protein